MALARHRPVGDRHRRRASAYAGTRGVPLGIDFSGGTIVVVQFEQPVSDDEVRNALVAAISGEKVIQTLRRRGGQPEPDPPADDRHAPKQGVALEPGARAMVDALTKANLGKFEVINQELVGPVIGADLQRKGIYATLASIVGITHLHRPALPVRLRDRRDRRDAARRADHAGVPVLLPGTTCRSTSSRRS